MKPVLLFATILCAVNSTASPSSAPSQPDGSAQLRPETSDLKSSPFIVDPPYLARHDIVYQAPMQLEAEGFPLGNGDMGGLIWTHDNGVEFQINKNDVWSNPEPGGKSRVPRHCARVKIDFGLPVFSWTHTLNAFEGRLSLARGEASFQAATGFAKTSVLSWLAQDRNIWVVECDTAPNGRFVEEGTSVATVTLERLGSRAFGGWYAGSFPRNPEAGLGHTRAQIEGGDFLIEEDGDGMHFVVACRILGGTTHSVRLNNHRVEGFSEQPTFTVLVSVATAEDAADPRKQALALLDRAERETVAMLKAQKDAWFASFWSRSFVKLGDDYLENLYYLRRYLMGGGSRGRYPVVFNGGLWRWNRDVVNWITPHHWNTQQQYWGLCAANDCDLMLPYLDTYDRMAQRPDGMARLAAKRGAKEDAILLAEMHNFDGTMVDEDRGDMRNNLTPAAQVAALFWEYYQFTGDKTFLAAKAFPFMKRAANFYLQKLEWDTGKGCFTLKGSVYEDGGGHGPVLDPQSDRNCIEALLKSCCAASAVLGSDTNLVPKWQHVLDHLWERRLVRQKDIEGDVIAPCDVPGKYSVRQWAIGGAVAFPAGLLGIDQKDTPEGKAVMNYIRATKEMYSHHPTPVIAARLGSGNDALRLLKDGVTEMQYFPQGLMFNCRGYPSALYDLNLTGNLLGPGRCTIKWRDFFQCGMETLSLCGTALTEMLLQSNEGKIRAFPAIPDEWQNSPLAFKLRARGGFLVAAERRDGKVTQLSLKSLLGNPCRLQNPWPGAKVSVTETQTGRLLEPLMEKGDVLSFETRKDQEYIVTREGAPPAAAPTSYASEPNKGPKKFGKSKTLGIVKGLEE
jgi:hypothetical protein